MHLQRKKENSISIKADSFCLLFRQLMNWPQFSKFKFTSTLHIFLLSIGLLFMAILTSVSTITDRAHLCSMEPLFMDTLITTENAPIREVSLHWRWQIQTFSGLQWRRFTVYGSTQTAFHCIVLFDWFFFIQIIYNLLILRQPRQGCVKPSCLGEGEGGGVGLWIDT